jgi:hypothetical protein
VAGALSVADAGDLAHAINAAQAAHDMREVHAASDVQLQIDVGELVVLVLELIFSMFTPMLLMRVAIVAIVPRRFSTSMRSSARNSPLTSSSQRRAIHCSGLSRIRRGCDSFPGARHAALGAHIAGDRSPGRGRQQRA